MSAVVVLIMRFARDIIGNWYDAFMVKKERGVRRFCDCPDKHFVKLVLPLGLGKRRFKPHFSHIGTKRKRCDNYEVFECRGGGESEEHRLAKHRLREMCGDFSFALVECPQCACQTMEKCCDGMIEMELVSTDRKWRYDCMYFRNGVPAVALEVVKTHFSSDAKLKHTRDNGIEIAEFRSEDIMALERGGVLENIRMRAEMCQQCKLEWAKEMERQRVADRLRMEMEEDEIVARVAEMEWAARNADVLRELKAREAIELKKMEEIKAIELKELKAREAIETYLKECWEMEIYLMGKQDREWGENYDLFHSEKYQIWLETWGTAPITVITYYA